MEHVSRRTSRCSLDLSTLEESQKENLNGKEIDCILTPEKRTMPPSISTKEIENVLNLFLSYDQDKDGKITIKQLKELLSSLFTQEELEDLFLQLSVDSLYDSGIIDWIGKQLEARSIVANFWNFCRISFGLWSTRRSQAFLLFTIRLTGINFCFLSPILHLQLICLSYGRAATA
jgi:hypothetical protein